MKIIYNRHIPFRNFLAINLFGVLFVRLGSKKVLSLRNIRHEEIHTEQMKELGYIPFYIIYFLEWLFKVLFVYPFSIKAYRNISFEREAYENQHDDIYLVKRKHYAQWRKR